MIINKVLDEVTKALRKKFKLDGLEPRVAMLEKMANPPNNPNICSICKKTMDNYEGTD